LTHTNMRSRHPSTGKINAFVLLGILGIEK
jgi:hypothetical protein